MVNKSGRGGSARFDEAMVHSCGRELWTAASYAVHARSCDGKPVQKRGRIERLAGRAGRALVPATSPAPARVARPHAAAPTPAAAAGAIAAAATDKAMELTIAGLVARRTQIDVAIAALEALRA